ncbi:MAG: hypothetical protein WHV66_08745 [Anaerolineales bacterium]|jgi:hypothetical protein
MNQKPDLIIEAVRYDPQGRIKLVRMYERRGPTYSDLRLIDRQELLKRLRANQRVWIGERQPYLASTFQLKAPVRLFGPKGSEMIISEKVTNPNDRDDLQGAPLF